MSNQQQTTAADSVKLDVRTYPVAEPKGKTLVFGSRYKAGFEATENK